MKIKILFRLFSLLLLLGLLPIGGVAKSPKEPILIAFDGEYGLPNSTSAQTIEMGLRIAIHEINSKGGLLGGRPLELITRDNRSVPARGVQNVNLFAENPNVVAIIGGRFSPVILDEIPLVHEKKVPLLDAWGSADKITEHEYQPSYTFRVSLKDRLAMPTMLKHAQNKGASRIGIFAPNTGWGRSNVAAAERYIASHPDQFQINVIWYNWGDKSFTAGYQKLLEWDAQALVMVANEIEGESIVKHIASLPKAQRLPIISHWGISGGNFYEATHNELKQLDFSLIQTFSFYKADPKKVAKILNLTDQLFGIKTIEEIHSPVGFGHAYDIVHLLAMAIESANSTDRTKVRNQLEQISFYSGLVKQYKTPFSAKDHDALTLEDVFMAQYDEQGSIRPLK